METYLKTKPNEDRYRTVDDANRIPLQMYLQLDTQENEESF